MSSPQRARDFPQPLESREQYMTRSARAARDKMALLGVRPWTEAVLHSIFDWGGHVARMVGYDASRWALKLLKWRDYNYLVTLRGLQNGYLHRGHRRPPWRWDHYLAQYFTTTHSLHELSEWHVKALSRECWEEFKPEWCSWRLGSYQ